MPIPLNIPETSYTVEIGEESPENKKRTSGLLEFFPVAIYLVCSGIADACRKIIKRPDTRYEEE